MRASLLFCRQIVLFLALGSVSAHAVLSLEPGDGGSEEHFPLSEPPVLSHEPPRSEPQTLESEQLWHDLRGKILNDFGARIGKDFHLDEGLRPRAEFWFDIYARYGEAHHIIHHVLYPWIIYRVVDTGEILRNGKGPPWLRHDRANKLATQQVREIRLALAKLARRKNYDNLTPLESDLYDKLMTVNGPRPHVFKMAAQQVRSQLGQKDFFQRGLINSSRYLPYMEEEFKRLGLPTELTRMPFVESSFNEDARSKVGASGIWQIMPNTGASYMIVNHQIDERNSPLKATLAAGRLLHSYNHSLDSWPLTITSYNHGIGNTQRAVHKVGSRDLSQIIAHYHQGDFKFASSNFYTCFLAALFAEKYNELIFKDAPREPLQEHDVLKLTNITGIRQLQKKTGLAPAELLKYNLDLKSALRTKSSLPRGYQLHLPPGYKDRLQREVGTQDERKKSRS